MDLGLYKNKNEKRKIKESVFSFIVDKNPNGVLFENIEKNFPYFSLKQIMDVISELENEDFIIIQRNINKRVPNRIRVIIKIKDITKYPIREFVEIGDTTIPRVMYGDLVGAEDWNSSFEAIASYVNSLERKFLDEIDRTTKEFWKSLITIFGVMLSMFALIIKVTTINTSIDFSIYSFKKLLEINIAQILPLCIVLVIFLCLLNYFSERIKVDKDLIDTLY